MNKAAEYRKLAQECLQLARQSDGTEQCDLLLQMAETWQSLANYRERHRNPKAVPAALVSFVPQEQRSSRFR